MLLQPIYQLVRVTVFKRDLFTRLSNYLKPEVNPENNIDLRDAEVIYNCFSNILDC